MFNRSLYERVSAVNLVEILEQRIYPALDRAVLFSGLNPSDKGSYYQLNCPRCQKREAFIYKDGFKVICNRLNNCGHSESILQYVAQNQSVRGQAFIESIKALASMANISLSLVDFSQSNNEDIRNIERKDQLLEAVVRFAMLRLKEDSDAIKYLSSRAIDIACSENFNLGYLPLNFRNNLTEYLQKIDFLKDEIETSGILADARWEARIIGPWRNKSGRIQTLWARVIEDSLEPKYLYIKNGKKPCPFGIDKVAGDELIAVEGLFDMMSLNQAGIKNVVALGGASISGTQLDYLVNNRIRSLTINLDYDPEDKILTKARDCAQKLITAPFDVYFINPTSMIDANSEDEKIDPDRYIKSHSPKDYLKLTEKALKAGKFLADIALNEVYINSDKSVDHTIDELIEIESKVDKPTVDEIWQLAAKRTGFTADQLKLKRASRLKSHERIKQKNELESLLKASIIELNKNSASESIGKLTYKLNLLKTEVNNEAVEAFSVDQCINNIKNAQSGKKTGWVPLDDMGIRLMPAELTIIGGRTGHGKTTALFSLLLNWLQADSHENYLLFSYELPKEAICLKLTSTLTREISDEGWSYNEIVDYLQQKERANNYPNILVLERAFDLLRSFESRLHVVYKPSLNVDDLCSYAKSYVLSNGPLGAILVDYLQLIPPPQMRVERRDLEVSFVSRGLKGLSVALSCPVIAAAQIGRQAVADTGRIPHDKNLDDEAVINTIKKRRPQLHHLREGGSEQEADLILGLLNYQADFLENSEDAILSSHQATPFEINVIKNRFGRLCVGSMMLEAKSGFIRKKGFSDRKRGGKYD